MDQYWRARRSAILWAMIVVASCYGGALHLLGTIAGDWFVDGVAGILLGLYICSHPVANTIDVLFIDRIGSGRAARELSSVGWLSLNVLVLVAGWAVTALGLTLLIAERSLP